MGADVCGPLGGPVGVRFVQLLGAGDGQVGSGAAAAERVGHAAERAERSAAERAPDGRCRWHSSAHKDPLHVVRRPFSAGMRAGVGARASRTDFACGYPSRAGKKI
jgi:hypothetical protein